MLLFALSDVVWQTAIQAIAATVLALGLAWIARQATAAAIQAKASADEAAKNAQTAAVKVEKVEVTVKATAAAAAKQVEDVKTTLSDNTNTTDKKLDDLAKVSRATHTLVNSRMAVQLELTAKALRKLAELTGEPTDITNAILAENAFAEHEIKQSAVDGQPGTDKEKQGQ